MTNLEITIGDEDAGGLNYVDDDLIILQLAGMNCRKNISIKKVVKQIIYMHVCELFCLYGQKHEKCFLNKCEGGEKQHECRIKNLLSFSNIYFS